MDENSGLEIERAVVELLTTIRERNRFEPTDLCSVLFTTTCDLDAVFPSQVVRRHLSGWEHVPFMDCAHLDVSGSLRRCIRVILLVNTVAAQDQIRHVYLRGARDLRPDLP